MKVGVRQVVLGRRPIFGEGFARPDFKRLLVVDDGLLQILGAFPADAVRVGGRQVVLGRWPKLSGKASRVNDFKCLLVVDDGLLQILGAIPADAFNVSDRQVVLGHRPNLRGRLRAYRY